MPAPSATRTAILDNTFNNGYPLMHGPIVNVQSGSPLSAGRLEDEIVVTNLNDSGAGSLRQACLDADNGDGGWITFSPGLNGTLNLLSRITINNPRNITIDGRGNDITLQSKGLMFDTSGSTATCGDVMVLNLRIFDIAASGEDQLAISSDSRNITPFLAAHIHFSEFNFTDGDEALDIYVGSPQSHGIDGAVEWCWFEGVQEGTGPGSKKAQAFLLDNPNSALANLDKFRILSYRNYFQHHNFRSPLASNDASTTNRAYIAMLQDYTRWREEGQGIRGYFDAHALNCTYDAGFTTGSANASDGARSFASSSNGAFANFRIDGERVIENPSFPGVDTTHPRNPASVTDMRTMWPSLEVEAASSGADTVTKNRGGNVLQATHSGTIEGLTADAVVGETFIVTIPSTRAFDASLDAASQIANVRVLDDNFEIHPTIDSSDIFTSAGDVVRTSATVLTFTASGVPSTPARIYLVWGGTSDIVAVSRKVSYLEGWNPIAIDPPAGGGTHEASGSLSFTISLSGSATLVPGTAGTVGVEVRGSIRNATEEDIRIGGVYADLLITGGRTIINPLTSLAKQAIVDGFSSTTSAPHGWNAVVRDVLDADTYVTRTSNTSVRLGPLPAFPDYQSRRDERINITFPEEALE